LSDTLHVVRLYGRGASKNQNESKREKETKQMKTEVPLPRVMIDAANVDSGTETAKHVTTERDPLRL